MEFDYVMSFLDPKYPNLTRIRYGPEKLRIFYGYFNYRPEPIRIRVNWPEPEPKISKYLLGLNI